jgi:hypothetical protein
VVNGNYPAKTKFSKVSNQSIFVLIITLHKKRDENPATQSISACKLTIQSS